MNNPENKMQNDKKRHFNNINKINFNLPSNWCTDISLITQLHIN